MDPREVIHHSAPSFLGVVQLPSVLQGRAPSSEKDVQGFAGLDKHRKYMRQHSHSLKNQKRHFQGYHGVCDNEFQGLCHRWNAYFPNLPGVWRLPIVQIAALGFSNH
ncbi:hypothetical protein FisN_33Hu004 [Fistulifera solaris]|uniref:Uncharacterized protein n=1 Tax=Fistulifera solaris TaxID=1519565 RepID=A0A1Z5KS14_FISSO|nr:hypothetical protein FisN_33Hu004 [Fistulifera solaris]|eukprot:GAX28718.1 hypothetical protein FisN_33Hu004 [Fistulifera solaris]